MLHSAFALKRTRVRWVSQNANIHNLVEIYYKFFKSVTKFNCNYRQKVLHILRAVNILNGKIYINKEVINYEKNKANKFVLST